MARSGGGSCLSWYNGWTPQERRATVPVQLQAFRSGKIERPNLCSICGFDKPKRERDVVLHNEDYAEPLLGFGCCRRCHNALHGRFVNPGRWLRLLDRVAASNCWARRLSLDPASQFQPYHVTYPDPILVAP